MTDIAFKIASNPRYGYQGGLPSMVYRFLIKNQLVVVLDLYQTSKSQMSFISQLLETLKDVKSVLLLKTILGR